MEFPCPWCRAPVRRVGVLVRGGEGEVVWYGGVEFVVSGWEGVVGWVLGRVGEKGEVEEGWDEEDEDGRWEGLSWWYA